MNSARPVEIAHQKGLGVGFRAVTGGFVREIVEVEALDRLHVVHVPHLKRCLWILSLSRAYLRLTLRSSGFTV